MAQWWLDHLRDRPVVLIRCGQVTAGRQCRNAIGEVKTDTERVMAMSRNEHPEVETDWTPIAAPTAAELAQELAELDAQVYCATPAGRVTAASSTNGRWGHVVAPVEDLGYYVCREAREVQVDTADLMSFSRTAADTPGVTATYWAHRVPE